MGIASLILGILSLCCCGCWTGIPAVILGIISMVSSEDKQDKMFGIIGTILGVIGTIAWLVYAFAFGGLQTFMAMTQQFQQGGF